MLPRSAILKTFIEDLLCAEFVGRHEKMEKTGSAPKVLCS
jgi:hypothetical protein